MLTGIGKMIEEMINKATAPVENKEIIAFPEFRKLDRKWACEFQM